MKLKHFIFLAYVLTCVTPLFAQKTTKIVLGHMGKGVIPNKGVNDPHIHIFGDKAYLFGSHDTIIGKKNSTYMMPNWNIYSSTDLVHWEEEFVLYPEDTYIGKKIDKCFATDGATRNGKYYFYFSNSSLSTGVAVSDKPGGPYIDSGKPIVAKNTKTNYQKNYDPTVFIDDDGKHYLIWGQTGWNNNSYQIAELNDDMVSLKTKPHDLVMADNTKIKRDASYLHKHNGIYYLNAHHGQYATSKNLYGPYDYRGEIEAGGDHGTFFTWHNQTYYVAGAWQAPYFRYTFFTYAHYRDNGEVVAKRDIKNGVELGVGRYDCNRGSIEAENFFAASDGLRKKETTSGFEMQNITNNSFLHFPKVYNMKANANITFRISSNHKKGATIEVRSGSKEGKLLGECKVKSTKDWNSYTEVTCTLQNQASTQNLYVVFRGKKGELMRLDRFTITSTEKSVASK